MVVAGQWLAANCRQVVPRRRERVLSRSWAGVGSNSPLLPYTGARKQPQITAPVDEHAVVCASLRCAPLYLRSHSMRLAMGDPACRSERAAAPLAYSVAQLSLGVRLQAGVPLGLKAVSAAFGPPRSDT